MSGADERLGWIRRLFARGRHAVPLDPARADLVVVAECFDDAEACSAALDRGATTDPKFDPRAEVVFRHYLVLPPSAIGDACAIAGQDGYTDAGSVSAAGEGRSAVVLQRVQVLDPLHCSQERSRMAGLAQRCGGTTLGWDAQQPGPTL